MSPFAAWLQDMRERRGLTQAELAAAFSVSRSYLSALELGRKGPPSAQTVARAVAALDLDANAAIELAVIVEASDPSLTISHEAPREVFLLLAELREHLSHLHPAQSELIRRVIRIGEDFQREA